MGNEKKYKSFMYITANITKGTILTESEIKERLLCSYIECGFIQEIQTEKQYWLGSVRLYQSQRSSIWYETPHFRHCSYIRIDNEIFQKLLSEGIITEREVEVGN